MHDVNGYTGFRVLALSLALIQARFPDMLDLHQILGAEYIWTGLDHVVLGEVIRSMFRHNCSYHGAIDAHLIEIHKRKPNTYNCIVLSAPSDGGLVGSSFTFGFSLLQ